MSTKQDARRKEALKLQKTSAERDELRELIDGKLDPLAVYVGYFGIAVLVGMVAATVCVITGVL